MQLDMFMQPVHDPARDFGTCLAQDRETIILADKLGFSECWIGEHITTTTEPITSPLVFMASLLGETKQIKLGTGVFCLAIKHPAVVAAEAALAAASRGNPGDAYGEAMKTRAGNLLQLLRQDKRDGYLALARRYLGLPPV